MVLIKRQETEFFHYWLLYTTCVYIISNFNYIPYICFLTFGLLQKNNNIYMYKKIRQFVNIKNFIFWCRIKTLSTPDRATGENSIIRHLCSGLMKPISGVFYSAKTLLYMTFRSKSLRFLTQGHKKVWPYLSITVLLGEAKGVCLTECQNVEKSAMMVFEIFSLVVKCLKFSPQKCCQVLRPK